MPIRWTGVAFRSPKNISESTARPTLCISGPTAKLWSYSSQKSLKMRIMRTLHTRSPCSLCFLLSYRVAVFAY
jgi:hypothetical protein